MLGTLKNATTADAEAAVKAAADAAPAWQAMPFDEKCAIILKAADLLAGPWQLGSNAASMRGQCKTAFQAEIEAVTADAAAASEDTVTTVVMVSIWNSPLVSAYGLESAITPRATPPTIGRNPGETKLAADASTFVAAVNAMAIAAPSRPATTGPTSAGSTRRNSTPAMA